MKEVQNIFMIKIAEKGLEFVIEIDKGLPAGLLLDEVRLRQVILNLTGNAVKFTEKGHIKITVNGECEGTDDSIVNLIVLIEDTGIGIPHEEFESIFEPFKQQSYQRVSKYGGTGLGLSISKKLVEMMNGEIRLESEPGAGSRFIIFLHDVSVSAVEVNPERRDSIDYKKFKFNNERVLIVEDIETNRVLLQAILGNANLTLLEAENGKEALQIVEKFKPDIILLDIRMPVMDGYEMVKHLRENPVTKDIPVIALSASIKMDDRKRCLENGFNSFISKPLNVPELFRELLFYLKYEYEPVLNEPVIELNNQKKIVPEKIENFSELTAVIKNEILPQLGKIKGAFKINDVRIFSLKLDEISEKYNVKVLKEYGRDLIRSVDLYDIKNIYFIINRINEVINELFES